MARSGWHRESRRHSIAARKGIKKKYIAVTFGLTSASRNTPILAKHFRSKTQAEKYMKRHNTEDNKVKIYTTGYSRKKLFGW
jgi:hypothetical protein